jgi:hypothetical protein
MAADSTRSDTTATVGGIGVVGGAMVQIDHRSEASQLNGKIVSAA